MMKDEDMTKNQLIAELEKLRTRTKGLEHRIKDFKREISEIKLSEESLIESEGRCRSLVENASNLISIVDRYGTIQFLNRTPPYITIEETLGTSIYDHLMPEYHEKVRETIAYTFETGKTGSYEARIAYPECIIWYETQVGAIKRKGKVISATLISTDITNRKRTEEALRENEARYRELFNTATSGVAVYEALDNGDDFVFKDFNRAGERIEGVNKEDIIGKRVIEVFPGVKEFGVLEIFRTVWRTGKAEHFSQTLYEAEHDPGMCRENWVYKLPGGEIVVVYNDVTVHKMMEHALRESEKSLRDFIESSPDSYALLDSKLNYVDVNKTSLKLLGKTKEEIIGENVLDIDPALNETDRFEKYLEVVKTGKPFFIDDILYDPRFGELHVSIRAFKVGEDRIGVVVTDVTKRKQAEQELHKRTLNLSRRVKQLNCLYDISTLLEKPGISLEQIFQGTTNLIPPRWQHPEITCACITFEGQEFKTANFYESTWKQKADIIVDGERMGFVEICYPEESRQSDEGPFPKAERNLIEAIARLLGNVIHRHRAEDALRESKERYRKLSDLTVEGIVIHKNGKVIDVNAALEKLSGYKAEEIIGRDEVDLLIAPEYRNVVREKIASKDEKPYEIIVQRKDGKTFPVRVEAREIIYKGKSIRVASFRDLTERRRFEEKARMQQQQLIHADKMASLGVLVAGVAHEINNPNHVIMITAQMLAEACESIKPVLEEYYEQNGEFIIAGRNYSDIKDQLPDYFKEVLAAARKINEIVSQLKEFSRQESSETMSVIDVNIVVKTAVTLITNLIKKSTKNFKVNLQPDLPKIIGNSQRLEQVLINLVQNACQSLPDNKKSIYISTSYDREDNFITVRVRDEGIGIPAENLSNIQEPFFTTRRTAGGSGLGLSISQTIINEHRGSMVFESKDGEGTLVKITLPVNNEGKEGRQNE